MKMLLPIIALAGLSNGLVAKELPIKLKQAMDSVRIVGGEPTKLGERPWMASMQFDQQHFCGASIINQDWVLTAAHCVESLKASELSSLSIRYNFIEHASEQGQRVNVENVYIHPDYLAGKSTDVALIKLASPITDVEYVKLATDADAGQIQPGIEAIVSGWGTTSSGGDVSAQLLQVKVPLISNEVCNSTSAYGGKIANTEICAGFAAGGKDSCQGDSGGPLVIASNQGPLQVGVVSWGDGCAMPNKYGVYARVSSFKTWFDDVITNTENHAGIGSGGQEPGEPNQPGDSVGQLLTGLSAEADQIVGFEIEIPEDAKILWIDTRGGEGDVDLVLNGEDKFSEKYYSVMEGNDEHILVKFPQPGVWTLKLHAYEAYKNVELAVVVR
ncbi:trypsin-like serine protease [Pseudoalteromonas sp.]|uniref:trypsin-like serine protease n=1 Tax=Pseudoalteromonas sp. TaxID=53249 RepID=UPI003561BE63